MSANSGCTNVEEGKGHAQHIERNWYIVAHLICDSPVENNGFKSEHFIVSCDMEQGLKV